MYYNYINGNKYVVLTKSKQTALISGLDNILVSRAVQV